jgi:hypothetical protein
MTSLSVSDADISNAANHILNHADLTTMTFKIFLESLEEKFQTNLSDQKSRLKSLFNQFIEDLFTNRTDLTPKNETRVESRDLKDSRDESEKSKFHF